MSDEKKVSVKMNMKDQTFEFEGNSSEYEQFHTKFKELLNITPAVVEPKTVESVDDDSLSSVSKKSKKGIPSIIKPVDFDVKPSGKMSYKEFMDQKNPQSNFDFAVCTAYFLKNMLGLSEFQEGHISFGFVAMSRQRPAAFVQLFKDLASKRRWFVRGTSPASWVLHTLGEDYVKISLPATNKKVK